MPFPASYPVKFLLATHPCYSRCNIDIANALYYGGDHFDLYKDKLIYRTSADASTQYRQSKLQVCEYNDYIAGIFDFFVATAFQSPPKIVFYLNDDSVERMVNQVNAQSAKLKLSERQAYEQSKLAEINAMDRDREAFAASKLPYYNTLNDGLSDLLSGRMLDMEVHGYGLIAISYPDVQVPADMFGTQILNGELDASFRSVSPCEVEGWACDAAGKLQWVKTHRVEPDRTAPFGPCDLEKNTWTFITETEKAVYVATRKVNQFGIPDEWKREDMAAIMGSVTPIAFGLPLIETSLNNRACLMERVKRPAVGLTNRECSWDFALNSQAYGQPWYAGKNPAKGIAKANEFSLWELGEGGTVGYLIPDKVAFDSLKESAERKQQNLFTIISAEALHIGDRDQHAASGAAKASDRAPAENCASFYAAKLKESLSRAVDYVIASRRDTGIVGYRIQGLDDFSPLALSEKIANAQAFAMLQGASKTAKRIALGNLSQQMAEGATAAEREVIDNEMDETDLPEDIADQQRDDAKDALDAGSGPAASTASSSGPNSGKAASSKAAADKKPPMRIKAELKKIDPKRLDPSHDTDPDVRQDIADSIEKDGYDQGKPVLAVELKGMHKDGKSVYKSLDGHHRGAASRKVGLKSIPAYIITYDDWQKAQAALGVDGMQKLSAIDSVIELPDGRTYDQVREDNDHSNGGSSKGAS
jgi:hypothetical protein